MKFHRIYGSIFLRLPVDTLTASPKPYEAYQTILRQLENMGYEIVNYYLYTTPTVVH